MSLPPDPSRKDAVMTDNRESPRRFATADNVDFLFRFASKSETLQHSPSGA
jgi:hypothetical protein